MKEIKKKGSISEERSFVNVSPLTNTSCSKSEKGEEEEEKIKTTKKHFNKGANVKIFFEFLMLTIMHLQMTISRSSIMSLYIAGGRPFFLFINLDVINYDATMFQSQIIYGIRGRSNDEVYISTPSEPSF